MKKFINTALLITSLMVAHAQTVVVKKQPDKIKDENYEGFAADIEGKRADATSTLNKILKEHGKIKFLSSDPIIVTNPILNGALYPKGILYAMVKENNPTVTLWIGIKVSEWEGTDMETIDKQLEKLVYQTGVQFYRDKVQAQIDETNQAADAVYKQIAKAINQATDLKKKLSNNAEEKIKLLQAMEGNKFEDLVLKVKIVNNKKAQDSLASAASTIQQMKLVHEEKLRNIN